MKIIIRPTKIDDAEALAHVRVTTWRTAYRDLIPAEILAGLNIDEEARRWRERLANMPRECFAFTAEIEETDGSNAEGQQRIAGYCICGPHRSTDLQYPAELYAIYVLPEHQGQGIGRRLLQAAAGWLLERGYDRMVIYVLRDNLPSRQFYQAMGGKVVLEKTIEIRGIPLSEVGYGYELAGFG